MQFLDGRFMTQYYNWRINEGIFNSDLSMKEPKNFEI